MKSTSPVIILLILVAAGYGWLKLIHDPSVRAQAMLESRDAVVDSMARAWRDSVLLTWRRDSVAIARADSIAEALRRHGPIVRTVTNTVVQLIPDPAIRDSVMRVLGRERAHADSVQQADSLRIAERDSSLAAQGRLLLTARQTIDSLTKLRDDWKKRGRLGRVGFGCTLGPAASTGGLEPIAVACGVTLRF